MAKLVPSSNRTNRLNLHNMVDHQLKDKTAERTEVFFNPYTVKKRSDLPKRSKPNTSVDTSVNSIYATVHSKLKSNKPRAKATQPLTPNAIAQAQSQAPSIPEPIAVTMNITQSTTKTFDNNADSLKGLSMHTKSIPKMLVNYEKKCAERNRRTIPTGSNSANTYNFTQQQRAREIFRQKRMLEEMLHEHQKLQRDRTSVAAEIHAMKSYLSEIREKLDKSLRKLNIQRVSPQRCVSQWKAIGGANQRFNAGRNTQRNIPLDARLKQ